MKISELIEDLEKIKKDHGDLQVDFSTGKEKIYAVKYVSTINEYGLGCVLFGEYVLQRNS